MSTSLVQFQLFPLTSPLEKLVAELPVDSSLDSLREVLASATDATGKELSRAVRRCRWISEATSAQTAEVLQLLRAHGPWKTAGEVALVEGCATFLQHRAREGGDYQATWNQAVGDIYRSLPAGNSPPFAILAWLAEAIDFPAARQLFLELLRERPPTDDAGVAAVFSPLFQRHQASAAKLFPDFLELLQHPSLAAAIVDLANFLLRSGWVEVHPALPRKDSLRELLGQLTQSLERIAEGKGKDETSWQVSQTVSQSVALIVSLCDTLALLQDEAAIGKLKRALAMPHRRICTEAAAALARLKDDEGKQRLLQLAEEPVARLRVLEYCQELGLLDQVDPKFVSPLAQHESSLCVWLAEPTQFGLPPTEMELVEKRSLRWPGFAEGVDCYLFRFTYCFHLDETDQRSYSNVGIAGPLAFAFTADLADLPPDDIYAAFAGYQAEHEEIMDVDVERLSRSEKLEEERLKRRLHDGGFGYIEPRFMGYFFGQKALVVSCSREGVAGIAIADFDELFFFPARTGSRSLGPREAYCIYKGRKLLRTFNPQDG